MNRVAIWGTANYNWLWVPLAERIKHEMGSSISFICDVEPEVAHYKKMDNNGVIDDFLTVNKFLKLYDEIGDERSVIDQALANETKYGLLAVDAFQADRHLGRGYASGGPYHPHSFLSRKSSYIKSLNWFNRMISFWEDYFDERQPALMVGSVSGVLGKAAFEVARYREIPIRWLSWARYLDYYTWSPDEFFSFPSLQEAFNDVDDSVSDVGVGAKEAKPESLVREVQTEWSGQRLRRGSLKKSIRFIARQFLLRGYWRYKGIRRIDKSPILESVVHQIRVQKDFRYLDKQKLSNEADLQGVDYIYYPLHVEPETSLGMLAPEFNEQFAVIQLLAKNLPAGVKLAVKEHVYAVGRRPRGFYRALQEIPNVILTSPVANSLELVKQSRCVAVFTSTAGFEASAMGIPVVSFGLHNIYNFLPHVYVVKSWLELRKTLKFVLDEENQDAILQRKKDGNRLLEAVRRAGFDLSGVDYAATTLRRKRKQATQEEANLFFSTLMDSLDVSQKNSLTVESQVGV